MRLLGRKNKFLKTQGREKFHKSLGHALDGIEYAINHERNVKIEIFVAILVSILGFLLKITILEWLIIIITISLVLGLELVNTAIERTVDLVTKDYYLCQVMLLMIFILKNMKKDYNYIQMVC